MAAKIDHPQFVAMLRQRFPLVADAIAAWGGAKRILVTDSTIEFELTTKAAKQLQLKPKFSLSEPGKLAGSKKARALLRKMTEFAPGRCIQFAEPRVAPPRRPRDIHGRRWSRRFAIFAQRSA